MLLSLHHQPIAHRFIATDAAAAARLAIALLVFTSLVTRPAAAAITTSSSHRQLITSRLSSTNSHQDVLRDSSTPHAAAGNKSLASFVVAVTKETKQGTSDFSLHFPASSPSNTSLPSTASPNQITSTASTLPTSTTPYHTETLPTSIAHQTSIPTKQSEKTYNISLHRLVSAETTTYQITTLRISSTSTYQLSTTDSPDQVLCPGNTTRGPYKCPVMTECCDEGCCAVTHFGAVGAGIAFLLLAFLLGGSFFVWCLQWRRKGKEYWRQPMLEDVEAVDATHPYPTQPSLPPGQAYPPHRAFQLPQLH